VSEEIPPSAPGGALWRSRAAELQRLASFAVAMASGWRDGHGRMLPGDSAAMARKWAGELAHFALMTGREVDAKTGGEKSAHGQPGK
jgi:hypothetical protein